MNFLKTTAVISMLIAVAAAAQQARPGRPQRMPEGTTVHRDIAYVTDGHFRQILDLYLPKSDKKLPLIIWVHGGAFKAGSKENPPAISYLSDGYAVASINYRLSQHAIFPAQIEDCLPFDGALLPRVPMGLPAWQCSPACAGLRQD